MKKTRQGVRDLNSIIAPKKPRVLMPPESVLDCTDKTHDLKRDSFGFGSFCTKCGKNFGK